MKKSKIKERYCYNCYDRNYLIQCKCCNECQAVMPKRNKWNKLKTFIKGHTYRGKKHYSYKGFIQNDGRGYFKLFKSNHYTSNKDGRIKAHRYIYETYYKCCLLPWIILHHKDGNKKNNEISNLEPLTRSQHRSVHNIGNKYGKKDMSNRKCLLCQRKDIYIKDNGINIRMVLSVNIVHIK